VERGRIFLKEGLAPLLNTLYNFWLRLSGTLLLPPEGGYSEFLEVKPLKGGRVGRKTTFKNGRNF
jgi:hypothetical protein